MVDTGGFFFLKMGTRVALKLCKSPTDSETREEFICVNLGASGVASRVIMPFIFRIKEVEKCITK